MAKTIKQVKEYIARELDCLNSVGRKDLLPPELIHLLGKCYHHLLDFIDSEETNA
jgi:hypothetical protein